MQLGINSTSEWHQLACKLHESKAYVLGDKINVMIFIGYTVHISNATACWNDQSILNNYRSDTVGLMIQGKRRIVVTNLLVVRETKISGCI